MNKDITRYVGKCFTYLKVKAEYQMPHEKFQPLEITIWKWEYIIMDFIMRLPKIPRNYYTIWVVMDRWTKSAYFIAIKETSFVE